MTATMTNGRPQRKQLSEQLDRLEEQLERHNSILDALSEGLNGAVTDAAKEGTKEAVTAAVIELLTNADLRVALHKASGPATSGKPTAWERMKAKVQRALVKVKEVAGTVRQAVASKMEAVKSVMAGATAPACFAWRLAKWPWSAWASGWPWPASPTPAVMGWRRPCPASARR